ncbi:uracil-DNA glycosylase family protein [Bifidobacterium dolichotidis]
MVAKKPATAKKTTATKARKTTRKRSRKPVADGVWTHVEHGFGPCWNQYSRVLFLGTMASPKSREAGFFYMHPQNRFWPVMEALFANPDDPNDRVGKTRETRQAFALHHGFALWDTVEACDILGASDASIKNVKPADLAPMIAGSNIDHIYPSGAKAMQLYEKYCQPKLAEAGLEVPVTPLPSTSPAYASKTRDQIIEMFRERIDPADLAALQHGMPLAGPADNSRSALSL